MIWLIAVAGASVPAPVAGSIMLRVIGMMEPSGKTGSPFGTAISMWLTPSVVHEIEVVVDELAP